MTMDAIIRVLHVAAGVTTLASMGIPLWTRKGGLTHRRAGWVFVVSMAILSTTSMWFCIAAICGLQGESITGRGVMGRDFALLLFVVSLLTGHSVFAGIRILKQKRRTTPHRHPLDWGFALALGLSSAALLVWGMFEAHVLLAGFGALGTMSAWQQIQRMRAVPTEKQYWWNIHMSAMIGGCIGAVTAFLVINTEQLPAEVRSVVPEWIFWLGPTVIGTPVIIRWRAYYRRQFNRESPPAPGVG